MSSRVPLLNGPFAYGPGPEQWEWSEALEPVFGEGFEGGPADAVTQAVVACLRTGAPLALVLPFSSADGEQRWLVWTGHRENHGGAHRVEGHVADITGPWRQILSEHTSAHLDAALSSRQTIDLAKGALMLAYGIDDEAAFELLVWCSQRSNTKVHQLAERLTSALAAAGSSAWGRQEIEGVLVGSASVPEGDGTVRGRVPLLVSRSRRTDGVTVLAVEGDLDLANGVALANELNAALDSVGPSESLVVDLSGVGYLGPVGHSVLSSAQRRALAADVALRLLAASADGGLPVATHG